MSQKETTLRHDLRIASVQRGREITILVNDIPVPAYEGESEILGSRRLVNLEAFSVAWASVTNV